MRILVVNGNTTQALTELAPGEARRAASPGTEVEGVSARFGAALVSNPAHDVIAALIRCIPIVQGGLT
jgi:allantoin racemase